jgi:hypothetical protein
LSTFLGGLAILLMVIAITVSLRCVVQRRHPKDLYLPALVFLLCSCALATVVQHDVLKVRYLTGRTALYLLLLGTFVAVELGDTMAREHHRCKYSLPVAAVLVAVHFLACVNVSYVLEWKVEGDVKRMIADVAAAKDTMAPTGRTTVLGMNIEFEAPINFYRFVDGLTWLNVADRRMKLHPLSDFYLYTDSDWRAVDPNSFVVLKTYPLTGAFLVRRRNRPSQYDIRFDRTVDFETPADSLTTLGTTSPDAAYAGLRGGATDARHPRSGGIEYSPDLARDMPDRSLIAVGAMVWMESLRNSTARLVVEFKQGRRGPVRQGLTVRDDARRAKAWFPVNLTAFVPSDVRPGDRLSVYLTNRQGPVYIDDLRVRWLTASRWADSTRDSAATRTLRASGARPAVRSSAVPF